ncbi:MAG: hypothetical protein JSW51_13715 [Gemmatimonadota bacterium]|nr:MAG: hypothetical protein JSW51_13715 [Gemmatimonadota bacterium]
MTARFLGFSLMAFLLPHAGVAQRSLQLRYEAPPGTVVRTAFQTNAVVWAFDGNRFESADVGTVKTTTLEGPDGMILVHLEYDSVQTRTLGSDGRWREFAVPGRDSVWTQVGLDSRMRVLSMNHGGQFTGVTSLQRILMGVPGLELPEQPVRERDGWSGATITSVVPGLRNENIEPTMSGTLQAVLDSIVVRSRDTLAYVSVSGQFPAATFVEVVGPGRVTATGDLVGSMIWSTSWDRFVSGTSRTRVWVVRQGDGQGGSGEELRIEVTTRHQVKP